ncbi:MAG: hypothetical protein WC878_00180 [Candidatus Paceibacterota bacterium]
MYDISYIRRKGGGNNLFMLVGFVLFLIFKGFIVVEGLIIILLFLLWLMYLNMRSDYFLGGKTLIGLFLAFWCALFLYCAGEAGLWLIVFFGGFPAVWFLWGNISSDIEYEKNKKTEH